MIHDSSNPEFINKHIVVSQVDDIKKIAEDAAPETVKKDEFKTLRDARFVAATAK